MCYNKVTVSYFSKGEFMPILHEKDLLALNDFKNQKVMDVNQLAELLDYSIPTVRRRLKQWGAYTSYNYNGRYYTLPDIPKFDAHGLWTYKKILFSRHGNLRQVVIHLIQDSPAGLTTRETEELAQVSMRSFMPCFRNTADLRREKIAGLFVYFSSDEATYTKQKEKRLEDDTRLKLTRLPTDAQAVIILVERINHPELNIEQLSLKLNRKGHKIKTEVIRTLFEHHDLLKKTVGTSR
jgi:hypothetical protein